MQLVGILNITPDSFSDGGLYNGTEVAVKHAEELFADGAAFVDIGAESTRPNAVPLSDGQEWSRLEPVLRLLVRKYPGRISLDTYHPKTIERAFTFGPIIVNDVTGMNNPEMIAVVTKYNARCIVSHLPVANIQIAHKNEPINSVDQVRQELLQRACVLEMKGLTKNNIILDPGIGFGKSIELNRKLLRFANEVPMYQVMIGYSRKRFLGENRMDIETNLEAGLIARDSGASYIRVHDVKGHFSLL